jgi:glucose 1-dehydrogenase
MQAVKPFIACDVMRDAQIDELVAGTVAAFGRLDCAVNNAAIAPDVLPIAEADMDQWDRVIRWICAR